MRTYNFGRHTFIVVVVFIDFVVVVVVVANIRTASCS